MKRINPKGGRENSVTVTCYLSILQDIVCNFFTWEKKITCF